MKKTLSIVLAMSLILATGTLAQSKPPAQPQTKEEIEIVSAVNMGLEDMARALAAAFAEPEIRLLVKKEVGKRFDGDFNALFSSFSNRRLSNGLTLREQMAESLGSKGLGSSREKVMVDILESIDALADALPRLQIAIPVFYEEWNAKEDIPLVTFMPFDADESELEELLAFDPHGNEYQLDAQVKPDSTVVVISLNERTDAKGNLRRPPLTKGRNYGDDEILHKVRIFDDNEGWGQGNPEIYMTWSFLSGYSGQYFPPGVDNENQWYYPNDRLFPWLVGYTQVYTVEFWEQDSGANDFMGSASIYFGETSGTCHLTSNGDVEFCMTHSPPPCTAVGVPQLFIVTSSSNPQFSWTSISGAESYYVYGSSNGSTYSYLGQTSGTTWTDYAQDIDTSPGGSNGGFYRYKVRSVNSGPNCSPSALSGFSNYIEFSVLTDPGGVICQTLLCEDEW